MNIFVGAMDFNILALTHDENFIRSLNDYTLSGLLIAFWLERAQVPTFMDDDYDPGQLRTGEEVLSYENGVRVVQGRLRVSMPEIYDDLLGIMRAYADTHDKPTYGDTWNRFHQQALSATDQRFGLGRYSAP